MIALYLAPVYFLFDIWILVMYLRWLGITFKPLKSWYFRIPVILIYLFLVSSIGIAFVMPVGILQKILKYIGNIWIGVNAFCFQVLVPVAVIRWILFLRGKKKGKTFRSMRQAFRETIWYRVLGLVLSLTVICCTVYGIYHGRDIKVKNFEVDIQKDAGDLDSLNVVMIGDIHFGYNVGVGHTRKMVDLINAQNPDIILVAGDIFDNEYEALDNPEKLIDIVKTLKAKYGVYSVYGNHDIQEKILAGFTFDHKSEKAADERMDAFVEACGWKHLRDEVVLVDDSFYIVGRNDEERPGKGLKERKSIQELMKQTDQEKPVIILDHEPRDLKEQAEAGGDLCVNGHVHGGQVFPGTLLMKLMWENAWGYKQIGTMHSVVTSGAGIWGPPMRIGTDTEICQITVNFTGK
ncbi:MAG: metallophosphoesterase [Lachnospiraceae bacterium]|nr:metallophosphoesterase [Lachnospiraceae bacterium]